MKPTPRLVLMALLAFCVTGCAAISGHMSAEGASKYASMSPEEFVKTRFYTEELGPLDHLSMKLGPDDPNRRPIRPILSADERMVVSVAHYNDINYDQLTRPRQNLQLFCETSRRGQWQLVQDYDEDPIAAAQADLVAVYSDAQLKTLEYLDIQNEGAGYKPAEEAIALNTAAIATRRAAANNALMAEAYRIKGFQNALAEGAFGVFQCTEATNSWSVSVLPIKFYPSKNVSNQLDTPTILVAIRPFRAVEQPPQPADAPSP
jgi:hypothetical protein